MHPLARTASIALLASSVLVAACKQQAASQQATPTAPPVPVQTVEAVERPMPRSLALTGSLRGERQTDLAANATGRVLETFVERGTQVKKGDLLAKLDIRAAALTAAEARAQASLAKSQSEAAARECERYKKLLDNGTIPLAEYDKLADQCRNAPLQLAAASARASAAALVVGDGQIKAPFDGVITERWVDVGEYVRHDAKVVSVVSLDPLRLELTVPEARLGDVKQGGRVTFKVPAYPDRVFEGTIRYIGAAVRETTRDVVAEAHVDNKDEALRPGMFAAVELELPDAPAVTVPLSTIVKKETSSHVFVVAKYGESERVEARVVQLGATRDGYVAVLRGLAKGDRVVEKPDGSLKNGQAVATSGVAKAAAPTAPAQGG